MANQIEIIIKGNSKDAVAAVNKLNKALNKSETAVDKAEKPVKKAKSSFGGLKTQIIAAAAAIGTIVAVSKKFIDAASDLEEETNKFNVVFRSTRQEAAKMRDELVNAYGMSRIEATKSLAAIQDFLVPMGIARDKATELSGAFNKMAVDIGSFNNQPTAQVMEDIKSAIAGMSRPMRKYGVDVSETTLKQMALDRGLKLTNGKLDNQTRAMLIYEKIAQDSADAQGDFSRSIESFANQSKIMKARISDISVEIGQILMPTVGRGIKAFNDFAGSAEGMEKIKNAVKILNVVFQVAIKSMELGIKQLFLPIRLLVKGIQGIIDIVGVLANEGMDGLINKGKEFFTDMKNRITKLTETFTTAFSENGIPGVVGMGAEAMKEKIKNEFGGIVTAVTTAFSDMESKAKETFSNIDSAVEESAKKQTSGFDKLTGEVKNYFAQYENYMEGAATKLLEKSGTLLISLGELAGGTTGDVLTGIGEIVNAVQGGIVGVIGYIIQKFQEMKEAQAQMQQDMMDVQLRIANQRLTNIQSQLDKELALYEKNFGAREGREEEFNAGRAAIEDKYAAKIKKAKKDQFETNKKISLVKLELDRAEAVSNIQKAFLPWEDKERNAALNEMHSMYNTLRSLIESQVPSFAQGGDFVTSGPEMIMVGDNPSGRERVTVTPEEQGMSGGIVIENMIVQAADAFDFGRQMQQFQAVTAGRL